MSHAPPPAPNWPDHTFASSNPRSSLLIPGMLVGALLLGFGCLSGIVVGYIGASANNAFEALADSLDMEPVLADVEVVHPESVAVGQPFDLVITVTDNSGNGQTLETLDLNGAVCDNFDFLKITPSPIESYTEYGWREYTYPTTILPNDSATYTLTLTPKHEGVFEGTVDAYFENWNSISIDLSIPVGPAN